MKPASTLPIALLLATLTQPLFAAALTPGDILITTNRFTAPTNSVLEYTPAGKLVQSWAVPFPGLTPANGNARGVTVSPDMSTIYVYNGTNPAFITTITPATSVTNQEQATNLATANVTYYGNVAASGNYLYAAPANGLVRFNTSDFSYQQFLSGESVEKVSIGADGLLYVLNGDLDLGWPGVEVYNPQTMALVRSLPFINNGSFGVTGDKAGNIFDINGSTVYEYSPTGTLLNSLTTTVSLEDIQISPTGQILLGGWGAWILTDESLSLTNTHYFATPSGGDVFVAFTSSAPEPATLTLLAAALIPLLTRRRP